MTDFSSVPVAEIRSAMDPQFNAILLEAFGCGIYTLLALQVIWKLHCKSGKLIYSSFLVIMWIATVVSFTGDWVKVRAAFVSNNRSPFAIFMNLTTVTTTFGGLFLSRYPANPLQIWRCNILWQKKAILGVLILLLCTTIGFSVYNNLFPSTTLGTLIGALDVLSSFVTCISATSLIALKIILVTRQSHRQHHYAKIIEILVQSAAVLSIVQLGLAVLFLIDFVQPYKLNTSSGRFFYQLGNYLVSAQLTLAGISPTLIAFRVATETPPTG